MTTNPLFLAIADLTSFDALVKHTNTLPSADVRSSHCPDDVSDVTATLPRYLGPQEVDRYDLGPFRLIAHLPLFELVY